MVHVGHAGNGAVNSWRYRTKMISGDELLSSVAYGWDLVKDMPDGRFLIRRKTVYV